MYKNHNSVVHAIYTGRYHMFHLQESYQYTCTKCNIHVPIGTMIFWKVAMVFNNLYPVVVSKQKISVKLK